MIGHTTPFKFLNAFRLESLRLCFHVNDITLLWICSLEWTVYESIRSWPCGWRSSSLLSRRRKGVGEVARKGKRGGLGREGKAPLPFPLFRAFLPPPPVFAPATQARDQVVSREGSRENTLVGIIILYDYSIWWGWVWQEELHRSRRVLFVIA